MKRPASGSTTTCEETNGEAVTADVLAAVEQIRRLAKDRQIDNAELRTVLKLFLRTKLSVDFVRKMKLGHMVDKLRSYHSLNPETKAFCKRLLKRWKEEATKTKKEKTVITTVEESSSVHLPPPGTTEEDIVEPPTNFHQLTAADEVAPAASTAEHLSESMMCKSESQAPLSESPIIPPVEQVVSEKRIKLEEAEMQVKMECDEQQEEEMRALMFVDETIESSKLEDHSQATTELYSLNSKEQAPTTVSTQEKDRKDPFPVDECSMEGRRTDPRVIERGPENRNTISAAAAAAAAVVTSPKPTRKFTTTTTIEQLPRTISSTPAATTADDDSDSGEAKPNRRIITTPMNDPRYICLDFNEYLTHDTKDMRRIRCRQVLLKTLEIDGTSLTEKDARLACEIEKGVLSIYGEPCEPYNKHMRTRMYCLKEKKNINLKMKLRNGILAPEKFAKMSREELVNERKRRLREKWKKESMDGRLMPMTEGTRTTMLTCKKCKTNDCSYNQLQTRSADEPMTTFVVCNQCGNRWKMN